MLLSSIGTFEDSLAASHQRVKKSVTPDQNCRNSSRIHRDMLSFRTHMERHERRSEQVRSASTKGQEVVAVQHSCTGVEDTIQGGEKSYDRIYTASDTFDHINSDLGPGSCGWNVALSLKNSASATDKA